MGTVLDYRYLVVQCNRRDLALVNQPNTPQAVALPAIGCGNPSITGQRRSADPLSSGGLA